MGGGDDETTRALADGATEPGPRREIGARRPEPRVGDRVGRYTLLAPLGEGGMGVVFAAHDERLDRRVAVKLLRPAPSRHGTAWSERRDRLLREAQAMAQLSHPNVVEVFDAGTEDQGVYIAMELVPGQTLRKWLAGDGRSWREVARMLAQAGRGLAAAHAVDLIHRDFKPANVLVDPEGRARVLDFGLALPTQERRSVSSSWSGSALSMEKLQGEAITSTDRLSAPLTEVGVVMGTPAYMAPEQHLGGEVGPAADQYAFCISLWEGLYGRRPFRGPEVAQVVRAKVAGPPSPPADSDVPRALHELVARGLATKPEDRWPSMDALLDELTAIVDPRRPWRTAWLVGGAAGAALLVGLALRGDEPPTPPATACADGASRIARAWNEERRVAVHDALVGTEVAYASETARRAQQRLDDYAERWQEAYGEVCEAEPADGDLRARRLACLARRLNRVETVAEVLAEATPELVPQAVALTQGLPSLTRCLGEHPDDGGLAMPDDPALAERVGELHAEIEGILARIEAGQYAEAHARAEDLLARAKEVGHAPLIDLVEGRVGETLLFLGRLDEAEERLTEALHRAESAGRDLQVVMLSTQLMLLVGHRLARPQDGLRWARHGEAALRRSPDDPYAEAELRTSKGAVLVEAGRREEAVAELQRAVALWAEVDGPGSLRTAAARINLGIAFYEQGRYQDAVTQYEEALRIREGALSPRHPEIGMVLNNLANARDSLGEHDEALALRQRVLEIWRDGLGEEHPHVAAALNNLGGSASVLGRHEHALRYYEQALALRERTLGPDHPDVATTRLNLGGTLGELGRTDEALAALARARESLSASVGEHPWTAICIMATGQVLAEAGRHERAVEAYEEGMAMWLRLGDAEHPQVAEARRMYAEPLLALGRVEEARGELEAALAVQERGGVDPEQLAQTRFALARALREQGEPTRARALAEQARAFWAEVPERARQELDAVDAWLGEASAEEMPDPPPR